MGRAPVPNFLAPYQHVGTHAVRLVYRLDIVNNLGGLTLVSPKFFDFDMKLAKAAAEAMSEEKMEREGNKCMKEGRKKVKEKKEIERVFLECSIESDLEEEKRLELLDKLINKVCNARFGAVLRKCRDHKTGSQGDQRSDQSLRGKLKPM